MDNLWRQEYEDVVLRPQIYGIENAAAAGIGPKMQLARDETPVMYAARLKRTIHIENPADDGQVHTLGNASHSASISLPGPGGNRVRGQTVHYGHPGDQSQLAAATATIHLVWQDVQGVPHNAPFIKSAFVHWAYRPAHILAQFGP
jgi:hypothetical protein